MYILLCKKKRKKKLATCLSLNLFKKIFLLFFRKNSWQCWRYVFRGRWYWRWWWINNNKNHNGKVSDVIWICTELLIVFKLNSFNSALDTKTLEGRHMRKYWELISALKMNKLACYLREPLMCCRYFSENYFSGFASLFNFY